MRVMRTADDDFAREFEKIRARGDRIDEEVLRTVGEILRRVDEGGDAALLDLTERFDGIRLDATALEVQAAEMDRALDGIDGTTRNVLELSAERIEHYHRQQMAGSWFDRDEPGIILGQQVRPLERVGIYSPGGRAPYPSTVLMAAVPARVAGVEEVVLVTPARDGAVHPLILAAAKMAGVDRVFRIGGAQAVAALAYGTETVPRVDKIVGPGNIYVTMAKKMVYGRVAIDMIAGPSEILIICDGTADPDIVAADLLSQAEHDEMAGSMLLTPSEAFARAVADEVERQLLLLPRKAIAEKALARFGAAVVTDGIDEAIDIANGYAPEHLELMVSHPEEILGRIKHAGAIFLGMHTPEALGDYIAGPNHILPTGGTARFFSPLGVYDFVKRSSVISFSGTALRKYGPGAAAFAGLEGLDAHVRSLSLRLEKERA